MTMYDDDLFIFNSDEKLYLKCQAIFLKYSNRMPAKKRKRYLAFFKIKLIDKKINSQNKAFSEKFDGLLADKQVMSSLN